MLRITTSEAAGVVTLRVEGRLVRDSVAVLEESWDLARSRAPRGVSIGLVDVSFVDEAGRALLSRLHEAGVDLWASGCATRQLVLEITGRASRG